jgi:hypothetical protein
MGVQVNGGAASDARRRLWRKCFHRGRSEVEFACDVRPVTSSPRPSGADQEQDMFCSTFRPTSVLGSPCANAAVVRFETAIHMWQNIHDVVHNIRGKGRNNGG